MTSNLKIGRGINLVDSSFDAQNLLRRCQRGDESALDELIQQYENRIYRFTLRVSGGAALAEEATTDCFYRVWTKCRGWRDEGDPEAWIFQIAQRTLLDLLRQRTRWWRRARTASRNSEQEPHADPLETLVETEQKQQAVENLRTAMAALKEEDRAIIHLYYFEEKPLAEIAFILRTTTDALKMRLMRIRKRLGRLLS